MKKSFLIIGAVTLLIIAGGVFLFTKKGVANPPPKLEPPTAYEYFWGNGCPHCANVEKFLESWSGKDKIKIDKKEVWYNRDNASFMAGRAAACGISQAQLAVPFLVTLDGKCVKGDEPIIEFFKNLKL